MSTAIGVSLPRLATAVGKAVSEYAVLGKTPGFTADFIKNKYPGKANFASAITHARSGNAVMTDGYGPELVTNGGFDSDSDWSSFSGALLTFADSELTVSLTGSDTFGSATQQITTVAGKTYFYSVLGYVNSGTFEVDIATTEGGSNIVNGLAQSSGPITGFFTATGSTTYINLGVRTANASTRFSSVSVREMPVLKWAPHNLLPYSEDFSTSWVTTNSTPTASQSDPFGGTSATKITADTIGSFVEVRNNITGYANTKTTVSAIFKAIGVSSLTLRLRDAASVSNRMDYALNISSGTGTASVNGTYSSASGEITDLGDGWYKANLTATTGSNTSQRFDIYISSANVVSTGDFLIADAHAFRSDLGGMVDNPDRGDSYVPTASAAKYLPRVGHHVYNGSAWVNEGVLAESESRVNQLTYSNSLNQWDAFAVGITTTTATASPDGQTGAYKAVPTTASGSHFFEINDSYPYIKTTTTGTTFTFSIYAKAAEYNVLQLASSSGFAARYQNFDLTNGVKLSGDVVGATIEDVGNGWYRCSVTEITTSGTNGARFLSISANSDITRNQSFAGDGTSGIYVWGAQAEEGHATPSSFIPSDDGTSTVTREAESFTIPSANLPWPEPVYIGSELVDATSVTAGSGWTVTDADTVSAASIASTYLAETESIASGLVDGNVYFASVEVTIAGSGTTAGFSTSGGLPTTARSFTNGTATIETPFVYDASNESGLIRLFKSGTNNAVTFDNISLREINPLSVSIGMEGRMTYADTGAGGSTSGRQGEVVFYSQFIDASNYLEAFLSTASTATGEVQFVQEASGVRDTVADAPYSPDILVPYNIASRHGSTFINGAVDGVALTANTTPTVLPDLSSTDLNLAYDYMGTISEFRVWDKDLGDAGLVEATNPSLEPSLSLTFEGTGTNSFVVNNWAE